ncbi:hypothetical protein [Pseudoroseomonas cervicalis]|nr:hypothetical protein [Pseudoroseomonas cervicalis]MDQ1081697.1 hypothetical protein [Pseudoroseomonas cervicalis]
MSLLLRAGLGLLSCLLLLRLLGLAPPANPGAAPPAGAAPLLSLRL